ncbi:MAG: thiamine-phosphate kinase [Chlorobi bacterium]|nr:thiamine-phosphate kinase [Chlorobiota bacterium]
MATFSSEGTPISEYGEFGLIRHLTGAFPLHQKGSVLGVGDDAAVIRPQQEQIVITSDLLLEGVHFNLMYVPLKHLGYKAVVVNLSDVYAMMARPTQIIVSIGVSNKFRVEHLESLYEGIALACRHYGVDMVGGDTSSSMTGLTISITAIGEVGKYPVLRKGAGEHDILCVTGDLGAAYTGLQVLKRENKLFQDDPSLKPELDKYRYVVERQLKPEARKDLAPLLENYNIRPTAMIDISDGLSSEALHICEQSDTGCRIYQDKIPIDRETESTAKEFGLEPLIAALNGGEDYELLFTLRPADYEKVMQEQGIFPVGHITSKEQGTKLVSSSGSEIELQAQGWDALK